MARHRLIEEPPRHRSGSRWIGQVGVALVIVLAVSGALWWSDTRRAALTAPAVDTAVPATVTAPPATVEPVDESAQRRQRIVDAARHYVELRTPYVEGGKTPAKGFDSSGLVWQILKDAGQKVPYRTSVKLRMWAEPIEFADLRPGDLVFYAHHVGVFVGDGQMVDASPMADTVIEHEMWQDPYPTFGRVPD
jgi:cell wall-associated NlpC family hydrolase